MSETSSQGKPLTSRERLEGRGMEDVLELGGALSLPAGRKPTGWFQLAWSDFPFGENCR